MPTGSTSRSILRIGKLLGFSAILVCIALGLYSRYIWLVLTDRLGTFHSTADLADLDGDGDLDVILHNVRNEEEFTSFAASTLWVSQGDG
jgi:hypothetical protein